MNKTLHIVAVTITGIAILFCGATSIFDFVIGRIGFGFLNLILACVNVSLHMLNVEIGKTFK